MKSIKKEKLNIYLTARYTRYQRFTHVKGMMRKIVGQAYMHVTTTMLSKLKYITIVMPKNNGIERSTLV